MADPAKCNECWRNWKRSENAESSGRIEKLEKTLQNFFEHSKGKSQLPKFTGNNYRCFLSEVHDFCLECQRLLPGWEEGEQWPSRDFEVHQNMRGFVGDFAILYQHITYKPKNINHLVDSDSGKLKLTEAAEKLCTEEYKYGDNVKLFIENAYKDDKQTRETLKSWQDDRDGLFTGETLLHILIVNNNAEKGELTKLLKLAQDPDGKLAKDNAQHFMQMVKRPADGLFFQPRVIYRPTWRSGWIKSLLQFISDHAPVPAAVKDWSSCYSNEWSSCYFGERPLAFAASVGNIDALDALFETVEREAEREAERKKEDKDKFVQKFVQEFLQEHDSFGNTALHMAVRYKNVEVIEWFVEKANEFNDKSAFKRLNYDLHSPLTLSVYLGALDIFQLIMEKTKDRITVWKYGRCSHSTTNLAQIDSWQSNIRVGKQTKQEGFSEVWLLPVELERELEKDDSVEVWNEFRKKKVEPSCGSRIAEMWKKGKTKPQGALEIAIRHEIENASKEEIFRTLIQKKWNDYVRYVYLILAIVPYLFFLVYITLYISDRAHKLREGLKDGQAEEDVAELGSMAETFGELVFLSIFSVFLILRAWIHLRLSYRDLDTDNDHIISKREMESFLFKNMVSALAFATFVLMWVSWSCRATHVDWEMNILAILAVISWIHGATFLLPFEFFGKLIIAIHRMVIIDLFSFLTVWIFTLLGFSVAMFALIQGVPTDVLEAESCAGCDEYWPRLALRYLWASLGEVDMTQIMTHARSAWLALGVHIAFIITSTILLLNLLIALLSKTFSDTDESGDERWWHEFGGTVLKYEQQMESLWDLAQRHHLISPTMSHRMMKRMRTGEPENGRCDQHDKDFPFHLNVTKDEAEVADDAAPLTIESLKKIVQTELSESLKNVVQTELVPLLNRHKPESIKRQAEGQQSEPAVSPSQVDFQDEGASTGLGHRSGLQAGPADLVYPGPRVQ